MIYPLHTQISCRYFVLDINCYLIIRLDLLENNQRMLGYIFRIIIYYLANIFTFFIFFTLFHTLKYPIFIIVIY